MTCTLTWFDRMTCSDQILGWKRKVSQIIPSRCPSQNLTWEGIVFRKYNIHTSIFKTFLALPSPGDPVCLHVVTLYYMYSIDISGSGHLYLHVSVMLTFPLLYFQSMQPLMPAIVKVITICPGVPLLPSLNPYLRRRAACILSFVLHVSIICFMISSVCLVWAAYSEDHTC